MVRPVDGMEVCQFLPLLFISLSRLLSLSPSPSLPLLSYKLVCPANSLPSSLYSCSPLFLPFVLYISLPIPLSLLWFASPFFISAAWLSNLSWYDDELSRWQHVGMSVFPLISSHLYSSLFLSLHHPPPSPGLMHSLWFVSPSLSLQLSCQIFKLIWWWPCWHAVCRYVRMLPGW